MMKSFSYTVLALESVAYLSIRKNGVVNQVTSVSNLVAERTCSTQPMPSLVISGHNHTAHDAEQKLSVFQTDVVNGDVQQDFTKSAVGDSWISA